MCVTLTYHHNWQPLVRVFPGRSSETFSTLILTLFHTSSLEVLLVLLMPMGSEHKRVFGSTDRELRAVWKSSSTISTTTLQQLMQRKTKSLSAFSTIANQPQQQRHFMVHHLLQFQHLGMMTL
jgi:uncharacterized lipoprotein YddW (UPF0748 family)